MDTGDDQPGPRGDDAALWAIRRSLAGIPAEVTDTNTMKGET